MAKSKHRGSVQNTGPRTADERSVQIQVLGGTVAALRTALQEILELARPGDLPASRLAQIRIRAEAALDEEKQSRW